jgi:hypothetical protein
MPDEALLLDLNRVGIDTRATVDSWKESVGLLAAFDAIGRAGSNTLVKIDGGRSASEVYTVVVSGGRLGERFFRKDGSHLQSLLREALCFYSQHVDSELSFSQHTEEKLP